MSRTTEKETAIQQRLHETVLRDFPDEHIDERLRTLSNAPGYQLLQQDLLAATQNMARSFSAIQTTGLFESLLKKLPASSRKSDIPPQNNSQIPTAIKLWKAVLIGDMQNDSPSLISYSFLHYTFTLESIKQFRTPFRFEDLLLEAISLLIDPDCDKEAFNILLRTMHNHPPDPPFSLLTRLSTGISTTSIQLLIQ